MAKVVLDVPDEFMSLVGAWQTILDNMKATVDRTGGGKAVDYAQIERNAYDQCREGESDIHHVSLQAVDIHVPMVAVGGICYDRVGCCEASYHIKTRSSSRRTFLVPPRRRSRWANGSQSDRSFGRE